MKTRVDTLAGRLARALITSVACVWLVCLIAVVWYTDREINYNFDNELVEVSHRMFDIALQNLDQLPASERGKNPPLLPSPGSFADAALNYQIITPGAQVIARSAQAQEDMFDVPLASGFENNREWRVYTQKHPTRGVYLQVADPLEERRETVNRTLFGLILSFAALMPLLALLLRHIARRELRVLNDITTEIALRDGRQLEPISLPELPKELLDVEEHVNRLLERLSQALDVERALAANAAHELRTPLAAARLRLQTALDHGLPRSDVEAALASLKTLSQRTEKLLQLSRAESSAPFTREKIDLTQLATTVAQEFWHDDQAADRLELITPAHTDPASTGAGDFDALAIALRNLVENALHYSEGSTVEIIVGPGSELAVRDHGPGVLPDQLERLTHRHVRQSAQRAGYGLGLSIVSTIVQKHDAQLKLSSPLDGEARGFEARIILTPAD